MDGTYKLSSFPKNLRKLMFEKGMSSAHLAEELDVVRMSVYNWRAGRADPSLRRLFEISSVLDTNITNLLKE
jgi:transcriptional regulator with XRE-family HTH domain|tara:strand:- start:1515 stop:1730 length:216 start_codon:yes stop_codon:yes gene_type:complete